MPSAISRLPSGKYRVLLRDGRRYIGSRTFKTRSVAEEWARQQDAEIDRIGAGLVRAHHVTVPIRELLDEYLASVPSAAYLLKSPRAALGAVPYGALTTDAVSSWIAGRSRETARNTGKRISPDTTRRELSALGGFLRWCYRVKRLPPHVQHPTRGVEAPKPAPGRDRRLSEADQQKMTEALTDAPRPTQGPKRSGNYRTGTRNPWVLPIMRFAAETGMRRGELCAARWEHVDLDAGTLHLPADITKTRTARTVPLSPAALDVLRTLDRTDDPRIFPTSPSAVTQAWSDARKRAGVQGLRVHDLRHEAASNLFELGFDTMEVAAVTGHKDLRSLKRYTHIDPAHLARKIADLKAQQRPASAAAPRRGQKRNPVKHPPGQPPPADG